MGNILFGDYPYEGNRELQALRPSFEALQLHRSDVAKLFDLFSKMDADGDGTISLKELVLQMGDSSGSFRSRVFRILDEDQSETLDFREFVLSLWNYLTLSKATLVLFAFDLYDQNSNGDLSPQEIQGMLHELYDKSYDAHYNAKGVVYNLVQRESHMSIEAFQKFAQDHPSMLFPAFQLQHALRQRILGVHFWERASHRRIELSKGRFIPVDKFIELNVSKTLYHSEVEVIGHAKGISDKAQIVLENTGTHHYRMQHHVEEEEGVVSSKKFTNGHSSRNSSSRSSSHDQTSHHIHMPHLLPSVDEHQHAHHSSNKGSIHPHPLTTSPLPPIGSPPAAMTISALASKKYAHPSQADHDLHLSLKGGTKLLHADETKSHNHYLLQLHGMVKVHDSSTASSSAKTEEESSFKAVGSSSRDEGTVLYGSSRHHGSSDTMEIKLRKVDKASDHTQHRQISRHSKYGRRRAGSPSKEDREVIMTPAELNYHRLLHEQELQASAKAKPKDIYSRRITF